MRIALWGIAAIVVVSTIVVLIAPLFISAEDVRNKLFAEVEAATGYRLRVSGPINISVFPSLDLVAEDVGVAQSVAGGTIEIATATKLRFGLVLSALLRGKVRMTEIALIDPVIRMPASAPQAVGAPTGSGGSSAGAALKDLSLDSLVIENGTVIMPDSGGTPGKHLDGVMLKASLSAFEAPLSFDLKFAFEGQPLRLSGAVGRFGPFLQGEAVPVSLDVEAPAYLDSRRHVLRHRGLYGPSLHS